MCCTPTLRSLIVSTLPPRLFLSTGYRPLGSCSNAAGWSAATLCSAFVPTISSLQRVVHGHSNKLFSSLTRDRQGGLAGTCLTRLESIYSSSKRNPANAGE
jgi:hypothetical protein